jgi:1-acyl-sn-glycerol-3-phosphate acyltransferase
MASAALNLDREMSQPKMKVIEGGESCTLDPAYAFRITSRIMQRLNESYFRSRFVGFDKPIRGKHPGAPVIYASNHSGMAFPWDGMALVAGMFERSGYQLKDAMRPITSPMLSRHRAMSPFMVEDFWGRQGAIDATMENFEDSMDEDGVNLLIYPEGIGGIGKGYNRRYEIQRISTSMVRMSIEHQADIVLVSTVGGEYINPLSYSFDTLNTLAQKVGVPFVPVGPSLGFVMAQPWMTWFAFPAKLTFVRGQTFRPYEMVNGRGLEDVSEEEIRDIRDKIHEAMQADLDKAVGSYGDKPFDVEELAQAMVANLRELHLFFPMFWPLLFWETEHHNQAHPEMKVAKAGFAKEAQAILDSVVEKEAGLQPTLRSLLKTVVAAPSILSLYLPGLGLWKMARGKL